MPISTDKVDDQMPLSGLLWKVQKDKSERLTGGLNYRFKEGNKDLDLNTLVCSLPNDATITLVRA